MLVLATKNKHKIEEFIPLLGSCSWREVDMGWHIEESGKTLVDNAVLKATSARQFCAAGDVILGEDTGLFVGALGGAPGVYSARYGGPNVNFERNISKLLYEMKGLKGDNRRAQFLTAAALVFSDGSLVISCGCLEGAIMEEARGRQGFGYDAIFFCSSLGKTLAQLSREEKNNVSHRAKAIGALMPYIDLNVSKLVTRGG